MHAELSAPGPADRMWWLWEPLSLESRMGIEGPFLAAVHPFHTLTAPRRHLTGFLAALSPELAGGLTLVCAGTRTAAVESTGLSALSGRPSLSRSRGLQVGAHGGYTSQADVRRSRVLSGGLQRGRRERTLPAPEQTLRSVSGLSWWRGSVGGLAAQHRGSRSLCLTVRGPIHY